MDNTNSNKGRNIFLGSTFIVAGIIWLLYNFNVLPSNTFDVIFSWQMMLIIIGAYLLSMRQWVGGAITASVGVLFMLNNIFEMLPVGKIIIPTLLIATGAGIIINRVFKRG